MRIRSGIVAIALFAAAPLSAATFTWPVGSCVGTLQACFDGAADGDTIQINANGALATGNAFTVDKGLTLEPAPGFAPVLDGGLRFESTNADVTVVVRDLQMTNSVDGRVNGDFDLDLSVLRCGFVNDNRDGVVFFWDGAGDLTFDIADSTFFISHSSGGDESAAVHLRNGEGGGLLQGLVQRNVIDVQGGDGLGGIVAFVPAGGLLAIHNVLRMQDAGAGIWVSTAGGESAVALSAVGNVISGAEDGTFRGGALTLVVNSGTGGLQAVGNTLADNEIGIVVSGDVPAASFAGTSFNNIVAFNTAFGFDLGGYGANLQSDYDLVFGNAANNDYAGATNQIAADPLFAGPGDYHLTSGSPARDSGNSLALAGQTTDVEGNPRIVGPEVDRGAYEFLPAVVEVPALGGAGLALLAMTLALAGWALVRR